MTWRVPAAQHTGAALRACEPPAMPLRCVSRRVVLLFFLPAVMPGYLLACVSACLPACVRALHCGRACLCAWLACLCRAGDGDRGVARRLREPFAAALLRRAAGARARGEGAARGRRGPQARPQRCFAFVYAPAFNAFAFLPRCPCPCACLVLPCYPSLSCLAFSCIACLCFT